MAKDEYFEDEPMNFNHRFKVETNMGPQGIVDHRDGWQQNEYHRGLNGVYETPEGAAPGVIKRGQRSKVKPPEPRPKRAKKTTTDKQDAALKKAAKDDLTNRGL